MKYFLYTLLLLSIIGCNKQQPIKQQALTSRTTVDTLNSSKPKTETTTNINADEFTIGFAVVSDVDGYSYIRDTPSKLGIIQHKLDNGTIVFCMESKGDWVEIDYYYNDPDMKNFLHGFIHKSRLLSVESYPAVNGLLQHNNSVVIGDKKINITVTQKAFNKSEHQLNFNNEHNYLEIIDGRQFWGTDGGIPTRQYETIEINLNGRNLVIPKQELQQLYEPNLNYTSATYDKENDVLYLQAFNSDGAGGYYVLWRIEKGVYKDRLIFYGF